MRWLFGSRDQDLAGPGKGTDPSPDDNAQPAHTVADSLHLPGMDPGSDLKPESPDRVHQGARASNSPGRPIECHEEPVSGGIDLAPSVTIQFAPDDGVEVLEQVRPPSVAEFGCPQRRVDDVDEHDGRHHAIRLDAVPHPGQELLDLVESLLVTDPWPVVGARKLDERGARNVLGDVSPLRDWDDPVVPPVEDQRRNTDRGQDVPHVDLRRLTRQRHGRTGARGESLEFGEPLLVVPITNP